MISREEKEIYTPKNREAHVVESSRIVASRLIERLEQRGGRRCPRLSFDELHKLIEKALVENDAYDVAKELGVFRITNHREGNGHFGSGVPIDSSLIRLIRRSGQVVPPNSSKIEVAIRKAFLSLHLDSEPAVKVSDEVTRRAVGTGQAFINIEDVQDIVQEELMKHGFFKVAESYILYRARRRVERETNTDHHEVRQDSMIVVKKRTELPFSGMVLILRNE